MGRQTVRTAPDAALSLSWDHRVIDGAAAARFNVYFASLLADFRRIVM